MGKSCSFALQYPNCLWEKALHSLCNILFIFVFHFGSMTMTMSMRSIAYGGKSCSYALQYPILLCFPFWLYDYDYVYEVNCLLEKAVHSLCNILFIFVFHFGSMTMTMSKRSIAYGKKLFIRFAISYLSLFSILAL